ncbi:IS3 family transposase, partial [Bosea vaviloviae]|uniref:IS3 family transposase n=1 Tax=Bosea vaviloviae TaxID=1526658 RepID=UPI0020BDFDEB
PASCSFSTAMICSSVNLARFISPSSSGPDSNSAWRKNSVAGQSLKKERIQKRIYKTRALARADIFDHIETFYNRTRRHSHLGGISPEAFERASA